VDDALRAEATARLERALAESGMADPREFCRDRLRELRRRDPAALAEALRDYDETLVSRVARGDADPIAEWIEYARRLAERTAPGRTVEIDLGGRARPYAPGAHPRLVLHLPDDPAAPALPVARPRELSPAQRAAYDLLVLGKTAPD